MTPNTLNFSDIAVKFVIFEVLAYLVFSYLNSRFFPDDRSPPHPEKNYFNWPYLWKELLNFNIENVKGTVERVMLTIGLFYNLPHVLIFFGTIKIGSRFDVKNKCKATTNYFILGNLISIIFVILIINLPPFF